MVRLLGGVTPDERLLLTEMINEREGTERDRATQQEQVLAVQLMLARGAGQKDVITALTGGSGQGENTGMLGEEA